jgi:hypothetical protein
LGLGRQPIRGGEEMIALYQGGSLPIPGHDGSFPSAYLTIIEDVIMEERGLVNSLDGQRPTHEMGVLKPSASCHSYQGSQEFSLEVQGGETVNITLRLCFREECGAQGFEAGGFVQSAGVGHAASG